jgi:hypothetical protein
MANKEELIQLLLDRVFAEISIPDGNATDWEAECRRWLRECRQVMRRHPGVAGLTLGRIPMGVGAMLQMEAVLKLTRRAGLPDRTVAYAGDLFGLYIGAFVHEEDMAAKSKAGPTLEDFSAMFRSWLRALPIDQFPNMVALADAMTSPTIDERFEMGLDVLIRGLSSYIPAASRSSRRARKTRTP